jgi:predicted alpha/beta hydrolase family esterase
MLKNVIVIHGCSSVVEEKQSNIPPSDRHWISWIREQLVSRDVPTVTPLMPEPWAPDYGKYKAEFEKLNVNEETTLVGHSCGCAFLVRWLGDSKQKIDKLILVAPWKIAGDGNEIKKVFYEYPIDETVKSRVNKIIMFTADNEQENGKKSLKIFHDALGGKIIELKGRGHYTRDDMEKKEFPELLEEVLN